MTVSPIKPYKLKLTRKLDGRESVKSFKTREARDNEIARIRRGHTVCAITHIWDVS